MIAARSEEEEGKAGVHAGIAPRDMRQHGGCVSCLNTMRLNNEQRRVDAGSVADQQRA